MSGRIKAVLAAATAMMVAGAAYAAPPPAVFVAKAGGSDLYERIASQTVLGSTRNPGVRRFANMMIKDHSSSTQMVKTAAIHSGLHPRPPDRMAVRSDCSSSAGCCLTRDWACC